MQVTCICTYTPPCRDPEIHLGKKNTTPLIPRFHPPSFLFVLSAMAKQEDERGQANRLLMCRRGRLAPAEGQLFSFWGGRESKYGFVKQVRLSGAKNGASGGAGAKEGDRQKELKLSPDKFLQLVKVTSCVLQLDPAQGKRKWPVYTTHSLSKFLQQKDLKFHQEFTMDHIDSLAHASLKDKKAELFPPAEAILLEQNVQLDMAAELLKEEEKQERDDEDFDFGKLVQSPCMIMTFVHIGTPAKKHSNRHDPVDADHTDYEDDDKTAEPQERSEKEDDSDCEF